MILKGLTEFLKDRDYDKITMSDIAECALITRMTLYRHFKNKEDILVYAFEKNIRNFITKASSNTTVYDLYLYRYELLQNCPYTNIFTQKGYLKKMQCLAKK